MTPSLGNKFPAKYRQDFCDSHLKKGAVLKIHVEFSRPPKIKRFAVLGIDENCGKALVSFINTEINPNVLCLKHLQDLQLPLPCQDTPYLDRDSYLNCSYLREVDLEWVRNKLVSDPSIYLGQMSPTDLSRIARKIRGAKTIKTKVKKKYGFVS